VVRGGAFNNNNDINLRCAYRNNNDPTNRNNNIGFRVSASHLRTLARNAARLRLRRRGLKDGAAFVLAVARVHKCARRRNTKKPRHLAVLMHSS
jgi:hypothetical protein